MKKRKKLDVENVVFTTLNTLFLLLLAAIMLYPMLNTLAVSFNDALDTVRGGIYLWPRIVSLRNYVVVLNMDSIYTGFVVSVVKMIVTVITNLIFTSMLAYVLSRKEFIWRKPITLIFVLTMYFNAGMIPNYLLMKDLHLLNTFTVYWLPVMVSAFNVIVIRTYIASIPESLVESAKIDGAGDFIVFVRIIVPLCVPALATIALFVGVGSWNSWFDNFLYNPSKASLTTLQYELQKLISSAMTAGQNQGGAGANAAAAAGATDATTPTSLRAAITIVTAVPILIVYPFLQRWFVNGLTIGGVKE